MPHALVSEPIPAIRVSNARIEPMPMISNLVGIERMGPPSSNIGFCFIREAL